jgi:GAF domain-containing protein
MFRLIDLEQKIIETIYAGACNPAALSQAPELIASYFDGTGAFFGELDYAAPDAQIAIGVGTVDEAFLNDYADYAPIDPAPEKFAALPTGTANTTDRMFPAEFLRSSVMLNEFLRPRGVAGTLGSPLLSAAGRFAIIGIHQSAGREPFDEDDIARLERLTPHLRRVLQIRRLFVENERRGQALEAILNRKAAGVIALARGGRALFVNEAARAMARTRDGMSLDRDGRLLVADQQSAKRLTKLEADVVRGGSGGVVRIRRPSGAEPYVVLVSPLPTSEDALLLAHRNGVLIAIHDPARRIVSSLQSIAQLLHLPLGAAKVVAALLDGVELKDHAERERISANTVKFHLKTAFERTGSRSQADLVRRALRILTDLDL